MPQTLENLKQSISERYSVKGRYFRGTYRDEGLEAVAKDKADDHLKGNIIHANFRPRAQERYLLIKQHLSKYLQKSILDVGSRDASSQEILGPQCVLVDKNNPNLPPFDWEKESLPYPDNSFDSIVCLDVLEHINEFHHAFDDLLRTSRKHIVISLPNCWRKMFKQMLKGAGVGAGYGLPPERPMDRHRWFFNTQEMEEFLAYHSVCGPIKFKIVARLYHIPQATFLHRIVYPIIMRLFPERYTKNLLVNTAFFVLEKE
ncbi:methyltransferase domain-containing protein [Patescibacteria group bacterium]|nr:methyltransferase domain-containing protein [Patescibacteria group bacterium]